MKKTKQFQICLLLAVTLSVCSVRPVMATTLSELKKQQAESQSQLNNVSGQISNLQDEQDIIEEEISDLDAEVINMMTSIGILEDDITQKEGEIEVATAQYEEAKATEEAQYEAMKKRIQFMYEKGDMSYVELMLESQSITDMLNKADYIEQLYEYDRQMLQTYKEQKEKVAALEAQLEQEKADLEVQKADMEQQKQHLDELLAQKKATSANYDVEIAKAKQQAAAFKAKIKEQAAQIKTLEAQEAAKKLGNTKTFAVTAFNTSIITNSNGSDLGKKIAMYGCQYIGNPYVAGGTSLTAGADCSGFIFRIYSDFGYSVPRTSYQLRNVGTGVDFASAQPGDIICYEGHVALYVGGGYIVHASSARTGIKISNAQYKPILAVRRVVS